MLPDNILLNLPSVLYVFALVWFPLVTQGLASISKLVARVPGLRPSDDTRPYLLRGIVFVANALGLLGFAFQQNLVLDKSMALAFIVLAAGQTVGSHYAYVLPKKAGNSGNNAPAPAQPVSDPSLAAALANAAAAAQAAEAALKGK